MSDHAKSLRRGLRMLTTDPRRFCRALWRMLGPRSAEYRRWRRMTLYEWMVYHERAIAFDQCTWMGIPAFKNPLDSWIYQEIVHEVRPEVIIEIGSAHGGSTLYFAHLLDLIGSGIVISIDIDRSSFCAEHPRIVTLTGDSSSPEILAAARTLCQDRRVLAILDGDHTQQQVLHDLQAYAPLVSIGSYFIVEDGIIDLFRPSDSIGSIHGGPLAATREFLRHNRQFVCDRRRERYILTYNPQGFLKRTC
jgi:cephalosporin hydroxylase